MDHVSKRRNLMIDDKTLEAARVLGNGNASEGVRKAVRHLAGSMTGGHVIAELRQWLDSLDQIAPECKPEVFTHDCRPEV